MSRLGQPLPADMASEIKKFFIDLYKLEMIEFKRKL